MSNPDPLLRACTEPLNDAKIAVRRDGRRAVFDNADRVLINRIDVDCWIPATNAPKADFILSKPAVVDVIVELKGKDIDHAVEQILSTLVKWKRTPHAAGRIGGLIVFSRCPIRAAKLGDTKKRLLLQHALWMEIDKDQKTEYRFETFTGTRP